MMDSFSNKVADSLCVGQKLKDDERVVLFVKMVEGQKYVNFYYCLFLSQRNSIAEAFLNFAYYI